MPLLDLSSVLGLMATAALTLNFLFGMLLGTAYKRHRLWKALPPALKRFSIFQWHNWTAYLALVLVVLHPALLVADAATKFTLADIVFPLQAPHQRGFVALGTVALFGVLMMVLTSQKRVRNRLGFRRWKNLHLCSYAAAILFIVHGIALDPQLKDRPVDFLDAEKLFSELCGVVLLVASVWRYSYHRRSAKAKTKQTVRTVNEFDAALKG
jgi:DMSO/TMAO reductase YedYZ heme-binding membrane subunit